MSKKYNLTWILLTVIFLVSILIFRLLYIGKFDLTPDEAYFWEWSRHLSISHSDQGPVLGLIIFLSTHLVGKINEFSVRLFSPILALFTTILVYLISKNIFKNIYSALLSMFVLSILPICAVGGMLITADIPLVFFWTISLFFVQKAISTNECKWWYLTGLSSALGIMSKYTMLFFLISVFLLILISQRQRILLIRKEIYVAFGISILGLLPMLIWNTTHNMATYGYIKSLFLYNKVIYVDKPGVDGVLEFITGQLGIVTPFIGLLFLYLLFILAFYGFKNNNDNFLLLFFSAITLFLFFGTMSYFCSVEENWTVVAYISLSIASGVLVSQEFSEKIRYKIFIKNYAIFAFVTGSIFTLFIYLQLIFKILPLDAKVDPTNRVRGWKELGNEVTEILRKCPDNTFILTNYFGIASELSFYVDGKPQVRCVDVGQRLRDYRYWTEFESVTGYDAVFVSAYPIMEPIIKKIFISTKFLKTIYISSDNQLIRTFYVFICKNYKGGYKLPKSYLSF